jgi:hypothetical protein
MQKDCPVVLMRLRLALGTEDGAVRAVFLEAEAEELKVVVGGVWAGQVNGCGDHCGNVIIISLIQKMMGYTLNFSENYPTTLMNQNHIPKT